MADAAFDPYAYAESQSEAPAASTATPAKAFDPYAYAAGGSQPAQPSKQATPNVQTEADLVKGIKSVGKKVLGVDTGIINTVGGAVMAIPGEAAGLVDIPLHAMGISNTEPANVRDKVQNLLTIHPASKEIDDTANLTQSAIGNLFSYIFGPGEVSKAAEIAGRMPAGTDTSVGAGFQSRFGIPVPGVTAQNPEGIVQQTPEEKEKIQKIVGYAELPFLGGGKKAPNAGAEPPPGTPPVEEAAATETNNPTKVEVTTPVEDMTPAQQKTAIAERRNILQRVGVQTKRMSALEANKKDAATDFQLSKTDTPAGNAAAAQFEHEKEALSGHAENIIAKTGGTMGLDEDSLANRGSTIAKPFDELRELLDQKTKELYDQAQERSDQLTANNDPRARTYLPSVNNLLNDRTFNNALAGKNQGHLLNAVRSQLEFFREQNPGGMTPAQAEQFRQFLNQIWSPDTKYAIGQLVKATDQDVLKNAGEDIYGKARAMNVLKKQILENPNGVADLFETDPKNPINRSTPYEKIPDKLNRLSVDQYENVIKTLKNMPPELQDSAQAAIGEIKAHIANKIHEAGTQTRSGAARVLWNSDAVNNVISKNGAKIQAAFADDPETLAAIKDLKDAGDIIKTDTSYPGAEAQKINLKGRGVMAKVAPFLGKAAGGSVGSVFGPGGAVGGTMAGGALGETIAAKAAEAASLKAWKMRLDKEPP